MRWLVDTDILIEGERDNPAFTAWLAQAANEVAVADAVRGEFLFGVHAVRNEKLRERSLRFYTDRVSSLASVPHEAEDFAYGARLAGQARRSGQSNPGFVDGLIAATAMRLGLTIATRNTKDFEAMGADCADPFRP